MKTVWKELDGKLPDRDHPEDQGVLNQSDGVYRTEEIRGTERRQTGYGEEDSSEQHEGI
jgi:hypothetical protein